MLSALSRMPIKWKMVSFVLTIATLGLLVTSIGLALNERITFRQGIVEDLTILANVIGQNSTGALAFDDAALAEQILNALRADEHIIHGCLYRTDGELVATYYRSPSVATCAPRQTAEAASSFITGGVTLTQPVQLEERTLGAVTLRADTEELNARLYNHTLVSLLLFLGTIVLTVVVAVPLQDLITAPIRHLVGTMRAVTHEKNYALRAPQETHDELGDLVQGFNTMLAAIEQAEATLTHYTEELERSNKELDDFAYIASHDLKEPLRGIHNYASFLLEDYAERLDDEGVRMLKTLGRLTQRMEELIDSLLYYSRVGRTELAIEPTALDKVVDDVLDSLSIRLEQEEVAVKRPMPLPVLECDRVRVAEVFRNLVTNAIKYNDKPDKEIEIGYTDDHAQAPALPVFYVRDNGIGIREKHREAIFQIFKRLHGRDKFGGGTGAGMTIVKKIVERHDGRIWLDSEYGVGTTFYFTLQADHEPAL